MTSNSSQMQSIGDLSANLSRVLTRHIVLSSLVLSVVIAVVFMSWHMTQTSRMTIYGLEGHYRQLIASGDIYELTRSLSSLNKRGNFDAIWLMDADSRTIVTKSVKERIRETTLETDCLNKSFPLCWFGTTPYLRQSFRIDLPSNSRTFLIQTLVKFPIEPVIFCIALGLCVFMIIGYYLQKSFAQFSQQLSTPLSQVIAKIRSTTSHADGFLDSDEVHYQEQAELISQFTAYQERAAKAEKFAQDGARLIAIGQTTSAIAHDIKGPLHIIKKFAATPVGEGRQKVMLDSVKCIDDLVKDLLDFSRPFQDTEASQTTPVCSELTSILDSYSRIAALEGANRVEYQLSLDELLDDVSIKIAPRAFRSIVANILNNAGAALQDLSDQNERFVRISAQSVGETVAIEIANNGPSLNSGEAEAIFQPFRSSRSASGGTGLGLAIVRKLVTEFFGTVRAMNDEKSGLVIFKIELPIVRHT